MTIDRKLVATAQHDLGSIPKSTCYFCSQAEDGIRYGHVTGVQTCALPIFARLMRSSMLEVLSSDYIKTAKAKGLGARVTIYRHGIRNAILPVVSYLGPLVVGILTGSLDRKSVV